MALTISQLITLGIVLLPLSCAVGMRLLLKTRPESTLDDAAKALAMTLRPGRPVSRSGVGPTS